MAAQDVRDTLKNESDLLGVMISVLKAIDDTKVGFTGRAGEIHTSWIRFLTERQNASVKLQGKSGADLKADLEEELRQVEAYIGVTAKDPPYSEEWSNFVECEADLLRKLINDI